MRSLSNANPFGALEGEFYNATVEDQTKYKPGDPTSVHWYSASDMERLIHSHIGEARRGGEDLPLGKFVRQFKGLSSTKKAKEVCATFPDIAWLSDFEGRANGKHEITLLLERMKWHSKPPNHNALGCLGREHIERRFEEFYGEPYRFEYKLVRGLLPSGLPYVFEFAVAEIDGLGGLFFGVNYSPTFGDPLQDLWFKGSEYRSAGIERFLLDGFAHPLEVTTGDLDSLFTAVLAHVVTPAPVYLEYGKTRLDVKGEVEFGSTVEVGEVMGKAMFSALKDYHKEGKRRVKEQRRRERPKPKDKESTVTLKDAVFEVLPRAVEGVSGGHTLPYSARRLYYRVRKLIQEYTAATLKEGYFRDDLLQQYQREKGRLEDLYYEARGELHEPHGGQTMKVGTREVEEYEFPAHLYNKLLYVEKRGQFPLLKSARLMERYDMAIMTGQGVATTAARTLMENASKGQKMQMFVLHDADHYGYNIAHTVREATERMPEYSVDVIDIGLTVEQGLDLDIDPEDYTRPDALYERVAKHLDPASPAWGFFGADRPKDKNVACKRIELDALSAPEAIAHIEKKLGEEGVYGKVIPSAEELPQLVDDQYRDLVAGWVDAAIYDLVSQGDVAKAIADELTGKFDLENARSHIEAGFEEDDALSWRAALKEKFTAMKEEHTDALKEAVREKVIEALEKE